MAERETIYDPSVADGRFQIESLAVRWALIGFYGFFTLVGVIRVDLAWFAASEGFLVVYHIYFTWHTWHELKRGPLPPAAAYAIPFLDTVAVSLGLIAMGDPLHPIWGVYFFIIVSVAFFYYPIIRYYLVWLVASYAAVGLGLHLRGADVPIPQMLVGAVVLMMGVANLTSYTGGERRLRGRISEVARTDPLTNLRNRRGLEETLVRHLEAAGEGKRALAVLMLDVDRFKRYNDEFGHLAADGVLEHLAELLSAAVREPDLVARFGGDEFVVVIPDVTPEEALRLAERLCEQVARLGLCTVSIGVSVSESRDLSAQEILDLADAALLAAKQAGRNCVRAAAVDSERAA